MAYLNEMGVGSKVVLEVVANNNKLEFETIIIETVDKIKRFGYGIICQVLKSETGAIYNFSNTFVSLKIYNNIDNRQYKFIPSVSAISKDRKYHIFYSLGTATPVNNRENYRVPCSFDATFQVRSNRKTDSGSVHDLSNTGVSIIYSKDIPNVNVGDEVSVTMRDSEKEVNYKVRGSIVRIDETYSNNLKLMGIQFDKVYQPIYGLVARLQRNDAKVRGGLD